MPKELDNPLICILTCAFEPPKPKTKHNINISSAEDYNKMIKIEADYFTNMVKAVKDSGATIVMC
jgi:T-complex protein 1 subunit epsilon